MNARGAALVLALTFCLCACSGTAAVKLAGGTWTEAPDAPFRVDDYTASGEARTVPVDWVLPEDLAIDGKTRTEACGEYLLFGPSDGSALSGFTVVQYTGEGTVKEVYRFSDGITVTWQPFFSRYGDDAPWQSDGPRIAFPWKSAPESETWSLRVVDLVSGKAEDLELPPGAGNRDFLFCAWDDSLTAAAVNMDYDSGDNRPLTWTYRFPEP